MTDHKRLDIVVGEIAQRDSEIKPLLSAVVERDGKQYLKASALSEYVGYKNYSSFSACIARAKITAANSGKTIKDHFVEHDLFDSEADVLLSPWAVNASLMEASPRMKRVAMAKSYFAALASESTQSEEVRLRERQAVKKNHKRLHGIAQEQAGVTTHQQHQILDAAGYQGMYGANVREVERIKGVPEGEQLLDAVDHTELAANSLRLAMAADKIQAKNIRTPSSACDAHRQAGETVRDAVKKELGVPPLRLPLAPKTIDQISKTKAAEFRAISKLD